VINEVMEYLRVILRKTGGQNTSRNLRLKLDMRRVVCLRKAIKQVTRTWNRSPLTD